MVPLRADNSRIVCTVVVSYRAAYPAKGLGKKVPLHKSWVDSAYLRRYLLASRFQWEGVFSYADTCDKSRRAGKD